MKAFLLSLALVFASAVYAQDSVVATKGSDWVRLSLNQPCKNEAVLARLPKPLHESFRAGEAKIGGRTFQHCWLARPTETGIHVFVMYDDGDVAVIPAEAFQEVRDVLNRGSKKTT